MSWTLYLLYTNFRNLKKRVKLDRRRLEAAHLKYAFLITATNYHGLFSTSDMAVYPNIQETLQRITPKYYSGFQTRYFGKESIGFQHTQLYVHVHEYTSLGHSCTFPGCGTVLILDGNMKNRRDICFAKSAGYIEFDGLSGSITTGCQASPAYKSRYCDQHRVLACDTQTFDQAGDEDVQDLDAPVGPILRATRKNQQHGENIVKMIIAKKQTRQCTYYKVQNSTFMHVNV